MKCEHCEFSFHHDSWRILRCVECSAYGYHPEVVKGKTYIRMKEKL